MNARDVLMDLQERGADVEEALHYLDKSVFLYCEVRWNGRLRTAAGRATPRARYTLRPLIELNPRLKREGLDAERQTFLHELAHIVAGCEAGHGPEWKHVLLKLGGHTARYHAYESMTPTVKVVGRCERCGEEVRRSKRLPRNRTYRHRGCGGTIERVA